MLEKLTNPKKSSHQFNGKLARVQGNVFKIAISRQLDNNFCFKDLDRSGLKGFHNFIDETIGKGLTISQVDKMFKRTQGPVEKININGQDFDLMHYGKDQKPFRLFGYYLDGFFHIVKIDPKHKTHKK